MGIKIDLQLFGGRGQNSGGGSGGGGRGGERFVADSDGSNIDLGNAKLKYGGDDKAVTGVQRAAVEAYEKKRVTAQIEFCQGFESHGWAVELERRGGKTSCRPYIAQVNAEVFTHNHPRRAGILGGTFSLADLEGFTVGGHKGRTMRASAKEGTYSITKGAKFDATGAWKHCQEVERAAYKGHSDRGKAARQAYREKKLTWEQYQAERDRSFNQCLVDMHNGYTAGQKKYGYTYTLERRK